MSARRKRSGGGGGEHHVDERWMASYMDMVTVLMCMFIVLFAMSSVDQNKFEQLKNSLATGFGAVDVGKVDTAKGVVVPPKDVGKNGELTKGDQALIELDKLHALRDAINANLAAQGLADKVTYNIDSRGLTVRLVGADTFFGSNSTDLTPIAQAVLRNIAGPLNTVTYQISVEGHADARAPGAPFPTNWELSSGRATQVLRDLVEQGGVGAQRIGATGYGSARPIATGNSDADYAQNRRVDIVVLSDQPEAVRALIPELEKAGASASTAATGKSTTKPEAKTAEKPKSSGH
jgi:chemotaxis protein MotB